MNSETTYDRFWQQGYHLASGLFADGVIDELEVEFDRIVDQLLRSGEDVNARWESAALHEARPASTVVHTHNVQNYSARWLEALQTPAFLDAVADLIGPDIVLHHTKLFQKPPGEGAPFPMHQDWRYFPTRDDSMIAAVVHLSDATVDMGCIRVHPASHAIGRQPSTSGRPAWDDQDDYRAFTDQYSLEEARPIEAARGDVLFFSYLTVHGSGPNTGNHVRKTALIQLHAGTDRLDPSSEHPVSGIVLRGWNHNATRMTVG